MEENYKCDSYKLIKEITTASIDLILTDPPYNLSDYSTGNIKLSLSFNRLGDILKSQQYFLKRIYCKARRSLAIPQSGIRKTFVLSAQYNVPLPSHNVS
jgi:adenine-specific DNA methylase